VGRSGENGSRKFEIPKMVHEIISTRRGPNTIPSQADGGPIII